MSKPNKKADQFSNETSALAARYLDQLLSEAWEDSGKPQKTEFDGSFASRHSIAGETHISGAPMRIRVPKEDQVHPFWLFISCPFPILNAYVQRRNLFANFQLSTFVLLGLSSLLTKLYWENPKISEGVWVAVASISLTFLFTCLISWLLSFSRGLKLSGVITKHPASDKIFLGVFFLLLLVGGGSFLMSSKSHNIRVRGDETVLKLHKRGFARTGSALGRGLLVWDSAKSKLTFKH